MLHLTEPNADTRPLFRRLLPEPLIPVVEKDPLEDRDIVLGVVAGSCLLGALVARPNELNGTYSAIHCLHVYEPRTDSDVERLLLTEGERRARALGFHRLEIGPKIPRSYGGQHRLLTLLRRLDWEEIRRQSTSFYGGAANLARERWYRLKLPGGYQLFPWAELTAGERSDLERLSLEARSQPGMRYLDPLVIEDYDPHSSFGVRNLATGRVAGWMITQPRSVALLCFRRIYILPDQRNKGLFHPLVANSVARCFEKWSYATFTVAADNDRMRDELIRMVGRYCTAILDCYYCCKRLQPEKQPWE